MNQFLCNQLIFVNSSNCLFLVTKIKLRRLLMFEKSGEVQNSQDGLTNEFE